MAQFNTPVGKHFWNAVIEGVSGFDVFRDDIKLIVENEQWARTLNALHVSLPATPDKTTDATALKTWKTLEQVKSEFDESSLTYETKHIDKVNKFINACKTRAKAFRIYRDAFTAFHLDLDHQCPLSEYLKTQFPGHRTRICTELGALETKHLTFPEVSTHMLKPASLTFLDFDLKWALESIVKRLKSPPPAAPPEQQPPADTPRRPLVVVYTKAHLEHMRACLLSM